MVSGTGSSVVAKALRDKLGGTFLPEQPVRKGGRVVVQRKHNRISEVLEHGLMTPAERKEYLVFATVRNPLDRWVTYYQRYVGDWLEYHEGVVRRGIERDRERFGLDDREVERRHRQLNGRFKQLRRRRRILQAVGFNMWMKGTLLRWYWQGRKRSPSSPLRLFAFPMLDGVDVVMRQERLEEGLNQILERAEVSGYIHIPRENQYSVQVWADLAPKARAA